jgi:hypothetical protein
MTARKNDHVSEKIEAFITCRTLRHAWDPIGAGDRRPTFGSLVCLRCVRCGTLRYDRFSRLTGERIKSAQYVYPAGYQGEKHPHAWWRATWAEHIYDLGLTVDAEESA